MPGSSSSSSALGPLPTFDTLKPPTMPQPQWQSLHTAFQRCGGLRSAKDISDFLSQHLRRDMLPIIVQQTMEQVISVQIKRVERRWEKQKHQYHLKRSTVKAFGAVSTAGKRWKSSLKAKKSVIRPRTNFVETDVPLNGHESARGGNHSARTRKQKDERDHTRHGSMFDRRSSGGSSVREETLTLPSLHSTHNTIHGETSLQQTPQASSLCATHDELDLHTGRSSHGGHQHHRQQLSDEELIYVGDCNVSEYVSKVKGRCCYDPVRDEGIVTLEQLVLLFSTFVDAGEESDSGEDSHEGDPLVPKQATATTTEPCTQKKQLSGSQIAQNVFESLIEEDTGAATGEHSVSFSSASVAPNEVSSKAVTSLLGTFGIASDRAQSHLTSPQRAGRVEKGRIDELLRDTVHQPKVATRASTSLGFSHRPALQLDVDSELDDDMIMMRATPSPERSPSPMSDRESDEATPDHGDLLRKKSSAGFRKLRSALALSGLGRKGSALTINYTSDSHQQQNPGKVQRLDSKRSVVSSHSDRVSRKSSGNLSQTVRSHCTRTSSSPPSEKAEYILHGVDNIVAVDSDNDDHETERIEDHLFKVDHPRKGKRTKRTIAIQTEASSFTQLWLGPTVVDCGVGTTDKRTGDVGKVISVQQLRAERQRKLRRAREVEKATLEALSDPFVTASDPFLSPTDAAFAQSHTIDEIKEATKHDAFRQLKLLESKYHAMERQRSSVQRPPSRLQSL